MAKQDLNLWTEGVKFKHLDAYYNFILSVLGFLCIKEYEIAVVLCNNTYIQKLNSKFRKKFEPTDVLSFSYLEESGRISHKIQGDLIISLEYLEFNSLEFNVEIYDELQRTTIHGILHLIGYTHETNDFQSEEMLIIQEKVLREIGKVF
ncbi:Endoribonuclease YbeY [Borrelia miyamotoi]|uniref:Endoribonuclease YbeY n=1 Tax=Borrelia miyamotoi TaxID=47466 RepID=A0AAP8YWC4_9SPIR|nr:rRNA maturation RNase YbeY [Borrelia miyamotoi]AHH05358.1 Putative metal-binding protein [Borrelia miyamotoi FR64b]ATQ15116.1 rRNA maturation RNase YbeY [Borrelia miyamotoi]ATQ16298.1 rRNA maturation RNase YbeY [Borrelia miyamotoi]ATQ17442.1 rRNA maturation RNase YbeY [Borrelia miyamotoi]ATQ18056.1 rRNA maturation RNase YbeY [Borrelia miyamotoi]